MGEHGRERAAVLALQPVEQREALLELVKPAGRRVDALAVAAQLGRQVVGLDGERLRAVGQRVELRVDTVHGLRAPEAAMASADAAPPWSSPLNASSAPPAAPMQRLEVAQPLALGEQRLLLGLVGVRALDLLELPLEQVELPVARAGAGAQLFQLLAQVRSRA